MPSLPLDDENRPIFTVGQVSDMLEIQQAFLRRLDQLGVVSPSRSAGRQRRYTRREITVVRYVVDLVDEEGARRLPLERLEPLRVDRRKVHLRLSSPAVPCRVSRVTSRIP